MVGTLHARAASCEPDYVRVCKTCSAFLDSAMTIRGKLQLKWQELEAWYVGLTLSTRPTWAESDDERQRDGGRARRDERVR